MKIGINIDENLKTILEEIFSYEYVDLRDSNQNLKNIDIVIIDSKVENLKEMLLEYKKIGINVIVLVGENEIREMRLFFLSGLIDDCIIRKDIFQLEQSINNLYKTKNNIKEFYLSDTFKKGFYKFSEVNFITYSSITRKTEFHITNSEVFDIKKNFSEIEEKLSGINNFYKLDRSTIINLDLIEILDFKEELIIFKSKEFIYTSKAKLKELENNHNLIQNKFFIGI